MIARWLVPLLAGAGTYAFLVSGRHYPWQLALLVALAIAALVYSTRRTLEQRFWTRRRWRVEHDENDEHDETSPSVSGRRLQ